ncbi:glycine--tRNA ligase subunit beta [Acidiphilium iwatense]|uniref:Glycine--tRNA ligase beta subunit n=1 Tax=Acidiphilium iwatense TaxID=768198 RepID=A0ABS9DX15_9PROT|nr:glycine--tRNA ligase subunit beta [Acidiphilium iwatense]MCF3947284.1 glycine--tRNA ligase subunit beta [Acidiphilium iwatense]
MPEFFLELFSEEIPARMQAAAAEQLQRIVERAFGSLRPRAGKIWFAPRRIAYRAEIDAALSSDAGTAAIRGPRVGALPAAIEGFLRKHRVTADALEREGEFFVLRPTIGNRPARAIIPEVLPSVVSKLPWPKSMRWGESGDFAWVRPLRRITCLLDGEVVPITIGPVTASDESEGHRFMAPGTFRVTSAAQWESELERRYVVADAAKRRAKIEAGLRAEAASRGLTLVEDAALLDEVAGLVEFPVPLIGRIEPRHMALPPEVRELSMRVNQRYFATRDSSGNPAPYFAFVANIEANDGGATIVAGNERVLRARLADAEHFWNLDRKHSLSDYLPKLKSVTFHARLGTQFDRAERIATLAREIAAALGYDSVADQAERAGRLCKADLVTGMVGEFPELQGIMGGYYADDPAVGAAIRTHYQPKGPSDEVSRGIIPCAVALADKLDTLREFFRIGEKPTGSGDPYALRRAALGVIRIILENRLTLKLNLLLENTELFDFILDRLRVKLRSEGRRFDILNAVFEAAPDDDLLRIMKRADDLGNFLATDNGANLVVAYRRAANILRIEDAKDGPHIGEIEPLSLIADEEIAFRNKLDDIIKSVKIFLSTDQFGAALGELTTLREPVDAFFEHVTVNADDPALRRNRLRLLARLRDVMHQIADFSKLEG